MLVFETGGFKGKRIEILREELHQRLKKASVLIKFIRNTEWQNCFLKPTLQVIKLLKHLFGCEFT